MKILFLTDNFPPEVNAPATRTYEHCREWVRQGLDVTVITCFPNFPYGKVYKGFKNKIKSTYIIEGIKVIRVWSYMAPNEGFIKRTFDFISFSITSFIFGLFVKTDLIIATSPQFFTALSGRTLSFFKRKPWIMEVRDLWPEQLIAASNIKRNLIIKYFEKEELWCYKSATKIVTVTNSFKETLIKRGIEPEKIHVIKNGFATDRLVTNTTKNIKLINELNLQNKVVIGYIGTHGMSQKLSFIIESIKDLNNTNNVFFIFVGDGADKEHCISLAKKHNISNIAFIPQVSKEDVIQYISIIDISLIPLKRTDLYKTVIPSKIFEHAAFGKTILLGVDGESRLLIEDYNAGLYYEPENKTDFLKQLKILIDNQELRKTFGQGALVLAKNHDRKLLAKRMLEIIENVKIDSK